MWDNAVHICPVLGSCCGADRSHNRQRTALWRVKQKQFNLSTEASVCKSASLIHFFFLFFKSLIFFKASSSLWWTQLWLIFLPKPTFQPITIRPMHKHRGMRPSLSLGFIPTVFLFLCVFCRCLTELKSGEFGNQDISFYVAEQFLP